MEGTGVRDGIPELASRKAYDYEAQYGNCAQCVLLTMQELFQLEGGSAFKCANGFAAGIGRLGSVCGAFSGAIMALGLRYGRDRIDASDKTGWLKIVDLVNELFERFGQEYGSILCRDIQKRVFGQSFDLRDPEQYDVFEEAGAHVDKCPSVVGNAAKWTAELLIREGKGDR